MHFSPQHVNRAYGLGLHRGVEHSTTSAQFTIAKIQGYANATSNSSQSEGMAADTQGWQIETCELHKNWESA